VKTKRIATCTVLAVLLPIATAYARQVVFTGYALNVGIANDGNALVSSGASDLQRVRLMATWAQGPWSVDLAWEQSLTWRTETVPRSPLAGLGVVRGTDWLHLQGTLVSGSHGVWAHRADRAVVGWSPSQTVRVSAGRQIISWATTLLFTPSDPFAPFTPTEPFREYGPGVDAVRVQMFPGPLSRVEGVVRVADTDVGRTVTALVRGQGVWREVEVGVFGGVIHDDAVVGGSASLAASGAVVRAEGNVRHRPGGGAVVRLALGVDRSLPVGSRDLYLGLEYQHDRFGAANAADLGRVVRSAPFVRGEMQVLGRDVGALSARMDLTGLVGVRGLVLWNAGDGSVLFSPSLEYRAGSNLSVTGGVFLGLGREGRIVPGSEYGTLPRTAYAALSAFF